MSDETELCDQIVAICAAALDRHGYPGIDHDRMFHDPAIARAFLALLRDCRPLPVITALIREVEEAQGLMN